MLVRSRIVLAVVCMLASAVLIGCGGNDEDDDTKGPPGKITRENYDKIAKGMELSDVEAILGVGTEIPDKTLVMPDGRKTVAGQDDIAYTWGDENKSISVIVTTDLKVTAVTQKGL